jgi:hypothetical protein
MIRSSKTVIASLVLRTFMDAGRQQKTYVTPEVAITVFELLMMGGVSPETF